MKMDLWHMGVHGTKYRQLNLYLDLVFVHNPEIKNAFNNKIKINIDIALKNSKHLKIWKINVFLTYS